MNTAKITAMFVVCAFAGMSLGGDKDLKKLEGTWDVVPKEKQGITVSKIVFKADQMRFVRPDDPDDKESFRIQLDPAKKPNAIDIFKVIGGEEKGPLRGIYALEGDTLKLCFSVRIDGERPKGFADEKSRSSFITLKKSK